MMVDFSENLFWEILNIRTRILFCVLKCIFQFLSVNVLDIWNNIIFQNTEVAVFKN